MEALTHPERHEQLGDLEVERKFLIDPESLPALEIVEEQDIVQAYFNSPDDEYELRIRSIDGFKDKYFAGLKNSGTLARSEIEVPISARSFVELVEGIPGEHVHKTRLITAEGVNVDIFRDQLAGLVIAEVEFEDETGANSFEVPSWFGQEVTDFPQYKNRNLIRSGVEKPKPNPEVIEDIIRCLYGWKRAGRPIIVGIAGPTASGKTTFAHTLAEAVGGAPIISIDDYNRGKERLEVMYGGRLWQDWDSPFVYDTERAAADIRKLKIDKQTIEKPIYDFRSAEQGITETIEPRPIIIVEGLFALDGNVGPLVDVSVFVDTHITDRVVRRLRRDTERLGWSYEDIFAYFMDKAEPANQQFVMPQKEKTQFVLFT